MKFSFPPARLLLSSAPFFAAATALLVGPGARAQQLGAVFVIDFENRNWTQPADDPAAPAQIYGSAAAPFFNSLVTPGHPNAALVSYATAYHNARAIPTGSGVSIHPSEPNYLWQEGGSNFGVINDNEPYGPGRQVQAIGDYLAAHPDVSGQTLTALLQDAGVSWKAYAEDIDLRNTAGANANLGGRPTSRIASRSAWTVPLVSFSGTSPAYVNPYNGSHQYGFACRHVGMLFFPATNGGTLATGDPSASNREVSHYAPLQQLAADLANNTVARYNLITPDLYNDMHTELPGGFTYHGVHYTGDLAELAQGDNFLSIVVPRIMASAAFRNNGAIILWTDETEGLNANDFRHMLTEIVISPLARGHAHAVAADLTHSSDVATMQEVFGVAANTPTGYLNDAARPSNGSGARDLADFFIPGVIPPALPAAK